MRKIILLLMLFVSGALSAWAQEKSIPLPSYKAGDWWTIKVGFGTSKFEIIEVQKDRLIFEVEGKGKAVYSPELNLIEGFTQKAGAPVSYSPSSRAILFPLEEGKKWDERIFVILPRYRGPARVQAHATKWEKVRVGAGEFDALRIEYQSDQGKSTCWYAPAMKRNARCEADDPGNSLEVIDFKVQ